MTIKQHIALSATITLAIVIFIVCQQKSEFLRKVKWRNDNIKTKSTKVEDTAKDFQKVTAQPRAEKEITTHNLLANSNFSEGLKGWKSTPGVDLVQEGEQNLVELNGQKNTQTRVWQRFNATSGHVYRLSFKIKAQQEGAFAVFRDDIAEKEKYLFAQKEIDWREYSKDFTATHDGNHRLFLSCQGEGKYYYKDALLIDLTGTLDEKNNAK